MKSGAAKKAVRRKPVPAVRRRPVRDAQLEEFETRDLGEDMRASGTGTFVYPRARATSIVLEPDLIDALRRKGAKRGLGYQTMLKVIVREHLDEY
jgi:predicted DNA binding CopG/RHH family protein